jgi:hypothetical protein
LCQPWCALGSVIGLESLRVSTTVLRQLPPIGSTNLSGLTGGLPRIGRGYRRVEAAKPQALSSAQLCSPHSHLNIPTVRPFTGLSIVRTSAGLALQLLHVRIGWGSKLEKTSFLNSSFMSTCPLPGYLSYKVNIRSRKTIPPRRRPDQIRPGAGPGQPGGFSLAGPAVRGSNCRLFERGVRTWRQVQ